MYFLVSFSATVLSFHDRFDGKKYKPVGVGKSLQIKTGLLNFESILLAFLKL